MMMETTTPEPETAEDPCSDNLTPLEEEIKRVREGLKSLKADRASARKFLHANKKAIKQTESFLKKLRRGQVEIKVAPDGKRTAVRVK